MTTMIGYLRVSTEEQFASGLGLEAQRDTIQRYADSHGWDIVWYVEEGLSAKNMDRPELKAALKRLHPTKRDVDGIVVAKLDRLSRSVKDFAGVLELARARQWSLVAIDLGVDTSTVTGELVANVMMAVNQWERRIIGERTSAAMQIAKRQGKKISRLSALPATTGERLLTLRATLTLQQTATQLNAEGLTTATGEPWSVNTAAKVHKRLSTTNLTKEPAATAA